MTPLQEITKIKQTLAKCATNRARQEGILAERLRDLKSLCGTEDVAVAKTALQELRDECQKVEEQLGEALASFKEEYAEFFEG
jgi:flagellar biosynthesis chaperone FliJ